MPAISIVMPVYNTREFVGKAIESVLNQTFTDYEFIIINNGATDGSDEVINKYAQIDKRIRVINNKENVFIAEARNRALDEVTGEYLYLIDSDDWILPNMLETMYSRAKKHRAQYVVAGYFMDYYIGGKEVSYSVCPDDRDYEQEEFRQNAINYLTRTILTVPWNKLYSIDYLRTNNIRFRNTKLEDHHFNMDIIMDIERVSLINEPFYHYYRSRQGTDSQLVYNKFLNQKKRDHLAHTMEVYEHWGISDEETMGKLADYHLGRLVQCVVETVGNTSIEKSAKKTELQMILNDRWTDFALKNKKKRSFKLKVLGIPFKTKNLFLCCCMGWSIGFVQKNFSGMFYKMRARMAQGAEKV